MRKFIVALLTAASLTSPALAQREPRQGGFQPAGERMVRGEGRTERPTAQVDRPQPRREAVQAERQPRAEGRRDMPQADGQRMRPGDVRRSMPARIENGRDWGDWNRDGRRDDGRRWNGNGTVRPGDGRWNDGDRRDDGRWNGQDRRWDNDGRRWNGNDPRNDGRWNGNDGRNDGRWNGNDRRNDGRWTNGRGDGGRWNRDWRRDPRYNWQDYRQRNRGAFNVGRYYAPRGWGYGYQRFSLGVYLNQSLFGQDYWLDDPFNYRLPPVDGPYRWVRYYGDVLLVDVRNGYVVDVIHDFFG